MSDAQRHTLAALLAWYRDLGVDAVLDETPTNWLERGDLAPGSGFHLARPSTGPSGAEAPLPSRRAPDRAAQDVSGGATRTTGVAAPQFSSAPDAALTAAQRTARAAATLEDLQAALAAYDGCGLKATAKNLCFYRGSAQARLMIVGEAPGREEDLEGKPFVGRAGQLLDKMLAAIELSEADVHITNIVYWRPPGNRTPTPQEAHVCRPFIERQIELVAPDILMTLGGPAAMAMLGVQGGIMKARGKWREYRVGSVLMRAMPTLHPAYLLRTPAAKRLVWRDLLAVKTALSA